MGDPKTSRRLFLRNACIGAGMAAAGGLLDLAGYGAPEPQIMTDAVARDWLERWQKKVTDASRTRYCDREMGEELGWLVSPLLNAFYHGYRATGDVQWLDRLVDWSDAWVRRGVKEPDGFVGWPKPAGASTGSVPDFITDNQLGEAMALRPMVQMAALVRRTRSLRKKYGAKAAEYLALSERTFTKWDERGCWREVKEGGVWVVPTFGLDEKMERFTEGYERRRTDGFTMPANKLNKIALWVLAMHTATGKAIYRRRAELWFRQMRSRMRLRDGKYYVWNYWDPVGPWDLKPDGTPKHWVGVHPNGGYYGIDVEGIVAAYEQKLVFTREDIDRLIATNRDFMWDQQVQGAKFQRIDGGEPDNRWSGSAGVLWVALAPHDATLRRVFEANHDPGSWGGLSATPSHIAGRKKAG